jgi:hypothetical protein
MIPRSYPARLDSASGMRIEVNANGSLRRMDCGDVIINLFLGTEIEGGPANVYLRRHGRLIASVPLLGPHGVADIALDDDRLTARGPTQPFGQEVPFPSFWRPPRAPGSGTSRSRTWARTSHPSI